MKRRVTAWEHLKAIGARITFIMALVNALGIACVCRSFV